MKTALLAFFALLPAIAAAAPGLTIYNEDFAVVRDTIALDLPSGVNEVSYDGATLELEPDSVVLRDSEGRPLEILEQNYRNDPLTQPYLLSLFEGQTIDFVVRASQKPDRIVPAKIIRSGYNPVQGAGTEPIIEAEGKIQFGLPGQPLFPSLGDGTILKPQLVWKIQALKPLKTQAQLGYITSGLSWSASYNLISPEQGETVDIAGWITMENRAGRDFVDAKINLMAGDVSKLSPSANALQKNRMMAMAAMLSEESVTEKAFDEFHLYRLPRPSTLRDRETKQVEFLRANGVQSEVIYTYDGAGVGLARWSGADPMFRFSNPEFGVTSQSKVSVIREFKNSTDNKLGIPLPKGRVRLYRLNEDQLEFTGENEIDHTAAKETVKIRTGTAFDLVGERVRTNFRVDSANKQAEESFEITLRNRKKEPVTIRVIERLYRAANWEITAKSHDFKKIKSDEIEFLLPVKADEEHVLTYTVKYSW